MSDKNLIIITGQEGAGKSTTIRALLPHTPNSSQIDAEDIGQTNPWEMNEKFIDLLWKNVLSLTYNFWEAGYSTVIAGSFLSTYEEYKIFKKQLPEDTKVFIIQLCASKSVRDQRRIDRAKPTKEEWRNSIDRLYPEDQTLQEAQDDYKYIRVENSDLGVDDTIRKIKEAIPEVYG